MAKSDFNVEEPQYNANLNNNYNSNNVKYNNFFNNANTTNTTNTTNTNVNYNDVGNGVNTNNVNYNDVGNSLNNNSVSNTNVNSNGSYYGQGPFINNADVVFEDRTYLTPEEKVKDFVTGLNKKFLIFIGGIVLAIIFIILVIVLWISHINSSYKAKVIIPDIVYMGETANVSVVAQGKKDLDKTKTIFTVSTVNNSEERDKDKKITLKKSFSVLNDEMTGKEISNSIVPIQEGISKLNVKSTLGKRKLANVEKEVVVCPSFSSDLLLYKTISLIKDTSHSLNIDFGEEICGRDIVYESSNEEIFTIDKDGKISALSVGKAILTIRKGIREISANVEVTDKAIDMASFSVSPMKVQLEAGENVRLKIDYAPANATNGSISFKSSDDTVATISDSGLVEAIKSGTTTIRVSASSGNMKQDVIVVVTGGDSEEDGTEPTEITLNKSEINLVQGNSEKILATVTPDAAKNKTLTWSSSDVNIATVDKNGVVLARAEGTAIVKVSTANNISKTIKVNVTKMKEPEITSSDKILSNRWHTKPFALNFTGAASKGYVYYYGQGEDQTNNSGSKVTISKDGIVTYYVKACTVSCQDNCKDKKVNGKTVKDDDGNVVKDCTSDCNPKPVVCSSPVAYVSKLDTTKPQVLAVVGIENHAVNDDVVQIAFKDVTSLIKQWCVTNVDSASTCKWKNIQTMSNPVVNYTATYNDTYYAFAKDSAGNVSNGYKFDITNIE